MFASSSPFLPFALLILQRCLTAAHPIKAPARIDLQPLLTLMQMSSAQLISAALAAAGWSSAFRGNFERTKEGGSRSTLGLRPASVDVSCPGLSHLPAEDLSPVARCVSVRSAVYQCAFQTAFSGQRIRSHQRERNETRGTFIILKHVNIDWENF